MNTLHLLTRRARARIARLAAAAACALAAIGLAVPAAFASAGDLAFVSCSGLLPDCTGTAPWNALVGVHAVAETPDGRNLYVAVASSASSGDISRFAIDPAGNLSYAGCIGNLPGCTATSPADALDYAGSLAVSPDGRNLYATAGGNRDLSHLSIGDDGSLTFDICYGSLGGCTQVNPERAVTGDEAHVAVTPDGRNLYVAVAYNVSGNISHFLIDPAGNLTYDGCLSSSLTGCTLSGAGSPAYFKALAVTPDSKHLYALSSWYAYNAVHQFAIDPAGNLIFTGCVGNNSGCTPVSPAGALDGADGLLVSPAGQNLYVSGAHAVSSFHIDAFGNLAGPSCVGNLTGCRVPTPASALEGATSLAATSDGAHVYVPSSSNSEVSQFRVDTYGNLIFAGCTGELAGCTGTRIIHALDGAYAAAVSPDDTQLYVAGHDANDVSHFTIAGITSR